MKSISSTHSQLLGLLFVAVGCNAASVRSSDGTQPNRHLQSSAGSLVLINANTEQPIVTLSNNAVIAVNEIPGMTSPAFALDAKFLATNNDVQSVVFGYGANGNYKTENAAPYAFCGNEGANFNACSELGYGTHTVTITPFAQKNGAGTSGVSTTVTFTIVASRATAPVKVPVKAPTKAPIITAPSATTPILINCGGDDYTDSTGRRWMKDQFFNAGSGLYCNLGQSIANSFIDPIYQCERNGVDLTYSIPVSTGSYDVVLHFAELFFDTMGQRVFNVAVEGAPVLSNLDLIAIAGMNVGYTKSTVATVNDGFLTIALQSVMNIAKISGIEIIRRGGGTPIALPVPVKTPTKAPITPSVPVKAPIKAPVPAPVPIKPAPTPISHPSGSCAIPRLQGDKWLDGRPYPLNVAEAQGMMIGTIFVVYGGFYKDWKIASSATHTLDTSNPSATWQKVDDIPIAEGLTHGAHVHLGSKIYNCGGYVGGHPGLHTTKCIVYDQSKPLGQRWSTMAPLPEGRGGGSMFHNTQLNAIYYVSGAQRYLKPWLETLDFNTVWMFSLNNPSAGWVRKADLPYAANHMMAVTTKDGTGKERHYAFGGQYREDEPEGNYKEHYEYLAREDKWVARNFMPYARAHATSSTHALGCGFIMVAGNTNGNLIVSNVTYYSTETDSWSNLGNVPHELNTPICDINRNTNVMYCETGRLWTTRSYTRQLLV